MISKEELNAFANSLVRKDLRLPSLPKDSGFPWYTSDLDSSLASYLNEKKRLLLPSFHLTKTISVFSDYGGEHPQSSYETYSFLFSEYDSFQMFSQEMRNIRSKHGLSDPYKEIEFKDLHYGPIKRALPDILNAANHLINGLMYTLIIDKRIGTIFGPDTPEMHSFIQQTFKEANIDFWKPKVREKNLRILHSIAYFLRLLSFKGQKLFWMTDHDAIVANPSQLKTTSLILKSIIDQYRAPLKTAV
jgi:hypothetical protein